MLSKFEAEKELYQSRIDTLDLFQNEQVCNENNGGENTVEIRESCPDNEGYFLNMIFSINMKYWL